eukprot:TRINITY_DN27514_c0_g1_i1.p1 TRINITY_DN27514_c0_g1~~TRINITY_DN27514_c0_g1_i1.p1  ORF type:complete len:416 (-),score=39.13 TRINITY_DN27514_c0_g1_i1:196-1443(-)
MASFEVELSDDSDSSASVPPPPLPAPSAREVPRPKTRPRRTTLTPPSGDSDSRASVPPPPLPAPSAREVPESGSRAGETTLTPAKPESTSLPRQQDVEFDRALKEKLQEFTGRGSGEDISTLADFIKLKLELNEVALKDELREFLGSRTGEFTSWVFGHMNNLALSSARPRVAAKRAPRKRGTSGELNNGVSAELAASKGASSSSRLPGEVPLNNVQRDQCPCPLQQSISIGSRIAKDERSRSPHRDVNSDASLNCLSRRLVKVLRHKLGLKPDEFAHVSEALRALAMPRCNLEDLREVVRTSYRHGTPRFELREEPGGPWIRAMPHRAEQESQEAAQLRVKRLSKAMCKMLRYNPETESVSLEGWTPLKHLLGGLRGVRKEDLVSVAEASLHRDGTPRFELREQDGQLWIRVTS